MTPEILGILGAIILVTGAAWPISTAHPGKSIKNWLFLIGAIFMLAYSSWNYLLGGVIFFIFLQLFVLTSNISLIIKLPKKYAQPLVIIAGIGFTLVSLSLLEDTTTIPFILGLSTLAYGYVSDPATQKGEIFLTMGSILLSLFSYLVGDMVFFGLNAFFTIFSGYYVWKLR